MTTFETTDAAHAAADVDLSTSPLGVTPSSPSTEGGGAVIDLTAERPGSAARTTVHIARDDNPFATMGEADRMRLFIRVLCELVAYGELDDDPTIAPA
ncbi:MAG: hypothetical protein U0Q07_08260 [Acidimicrobiales bacterium]